MWPKEHLLLGRWQQGFEGVSFHCMGIKWEKAHDWKWLLSPWSHLARADLHCESDGFSPQQGQVQVPQVLALWWGTAALGLSWVWLLQVMSGQVVLRQKKKPTNYFLAFRRAHFRSVKYRWCQISKVLAFLLQKATADTGNYILCREITSGWRSFELRKGRNEKTRVGWWKKREMRVVFSEAQVFGEEVKSWGLCCYHSDLYKQLVGQQLSKLPCTSPDHTFGAVLDKGALPAPAREMLDRGCFPSLDVFKDRATLAWHSTGQSSTARENSGATIHLLWDTSWGQLVAFSIASSARAATLPFRERKAQTKQYNTPPKSSFSKHGIN